MLENVCERDGCRHSLLTCGVSDRESNEIKYLKGATELIEEWQKQLPGVPPVNLQVSEHEEVVFVEAAKYRVSFVLCCEYNSVEGTSIQSRHVRGCVEFCGVSRGLRLLLVLDWSISIFSTVSCTVESLTMNRWQTFAGRPGSERSLSLSCNSIRSPSRRICAHKIHSATRRKNAIPIFVWRSVCISLERVW